MKKGALFILVVLAMASPVLSQQQAGDSELQLQGSLSLGLNDEIPDSGTVFLNYGRFLSDRQEVGVTALGIILGDGDVAGFGGPFYRYNFSTGKTVPYVGAAAAVAFGDYEIGDALLTFEGGVRWFLERNTAFSLSASTNYDVDASEFSDRLQILAGFSYLWGK